MKSEYCCAVICFIKLIYSPIITHLHLSVRHFCCPFSELNFVVYILLFFCADVQIVFDHLDSVHGVGLVLWIFFISLLRSSFVISCVRE